MMSNWQYSEHVPSTFNYKFGSGYPSDPTCQEWLRNHQCSVFGYPDVVRFSWAPIKKILQEQNPVQVIFPADLETNEDGEENNYHITNSKPLLQKRLGSFLGPAGKRKRYPYFEKRKLQPVTKLI
jgi:ribonuclease H2 subunit A